MPARPARSVLGAALLLSSLSSLSLLGCERQRESSERAPAGKPSEPAKDQPPRAVRERSDRYDLVEHAARCEAEHRGRLIDLGTNAAAIWSSFQGLKPSADENVIRDGATLLRTNARELGYDFWLDEHVDALDMSVRVRGVQAKWMYVSIDGRRAGSLRLQDSDHKVHALPTFKEPLDPGRHRVTLRFPRPPKGVTKPLAELDWIRIGGKDDPPSRYAAPTLSDVVSDVSLGNAPRRSFVLRGGSTLRCFIKPSADAKLSLSLGLWGAGSGVAAVRVVRDTGTPVTLQTRRLSGGDNATWTELDLELGEYESDVIGLELAALDATRGARVAFGDPLIVRKASALAEAPLARTVVLVVFSGIDRSYVPPWAPTGQLVGLGELARTGIAFSHYRAPSTVVGATLATMLSGLPPGAHRLENPTDRLPQGLRMVQRIVKEASGRAAMFTSVPSTFGDFGFGSGWDVYESFSPVNDIAASEPFSRAARWLDHELEDDENGRRFVLIHARGAHPPWDISREEAQQLKPTEYSGAVDPRRGGIVLGALRTRTRRNVKRLTEDDWIRLRALGEAALVKQDQGLRKLISVLKAQNAYDSTLLMVVGDVAPAALPELPFDPAGPLTEDRLALPLLAKFPQQPSAGTEITAPANAADLPVTVLSALGLRAEGLRGVDLYERAQGRRELTGAVQVATLPGRYATRIGPWLLRGTLGQVPTLCALDVDPACSRDVFNEYSVAARAAWLATYADLVSATSSTNRLEQTPATLERATRAALAVWGDIPPF